MSVLVFPLYTPSGSGPTYLDKGVLRPEHTPTLAVPTVTVKAGVGEIPLTRSNQIAGSRAGRHHQFSAGAKPPVLGPQPLAHTSNPLKINYLDVSDAVEAGRSKTPFPERRCFRGRLVVRPSACSVQDK